MARPARFASGGGNMVPGYAALAAANAGVALTPALGMTEETWLNAGAAEAQPCGTDSTPSEAARPTLAVIAALLILAEPIPAEPNAPVPEPIPLPIAEPKI